MSFMVFCALVIFPDSSYYFSLNYDNVLVKIIKRKVQGRGKWSLNDSVLANAAGPVHLPFVYFFSQPWLI